MESLKLQGLILGIAKTGKRTLLQRFQGKDPFDSSNQQPHDTDLYDPNAEVIIPYQTNHTAWDDRIQLHLRADPSTPKQELHPTELIDFFIVLVDPRRSSQQVRSYLETAIGRILESKGYPSSSESGHRNGHQTTSQLPPHRPVCICVLRNFRDLQSNSANAPFNISIVDLEQWVADIFQDYPTISRDHFVVQVEMASLRNCFGLNALHHFIYLSYLQRKQWETERRLWELQQQVKVASSDIPRMDYDEFLKLVQSTTKDSASPTRRQQRLQQQTTTPELSERQPHLPNATQPAVPRRIVSTAARESVLLVPRTHADNAPLSLEAFLESDDDDGMPARRSEEYDEIEGQGRSDDDSELEDEDDSFFYDDKGKRHGSSSPIGKKRIIVPVEGKFPSIRPSTNGQLPPSSSQTKPMQSSSLPATQNKSTPRPKPDNGQVSQPIGESVVSSTIASSSVALKDAEDKLSDDHTNSEKRHVNVQQDQTLSYEVPEESSDNQQQAADDMDTVVASDPAGDNDYALSSRNRQQRVADSTDRHEQNEHQILGSDDLPNQASEMEINDGWDDDNFDDADDDDDALANRKDDQSEHVKHKDSDMDDDDDDAYVIGEERKVNKSPDADAFTKTDVDDDDDGDYMVNEGPTNDEVEMKLHAPGNVTPPALVASESVAEAAALDSKAALSKAALEAIAEAERNAERMLREYDNGLDDEGHPTSTEKKPKKKKKRDTKDPVMKRKKKDKARETKRSNGEN